MSERRILVVGAGIGGLAVARTLARAGFSVEVVEREPAWDEAGMGIYLPGNAARALRALGLEQAVLERAVVIPRQRVSDDRGRLLMEVDLAELWDGVGPCLALPRAQLQAVLLDGARDVPIRTGVDVRGLSERDGTLSVEFGDGTAGEYDLVIGADGIHSTVRRLAFGSEATAQPVGQVGWRFTTACPAEITTWSVMRGPSSTFCSAAAVRAASCAQRRKDGPASRRPCPPDGVPCCSVDVETRTLVRRSVSDARRRLTGVEFDESGVAGMQALGSRNKSLPLVAWEACDGDSLLALAYVLDVLKAKQEGQLDAA